VDHLANREAWDDVIGLRAACLAATEETGRQLWGPARYAAYRTALDAPATLAAAMLEPGVVRFGLGPLTEVIAQHHTFDALAPHLDTTLLPVVAQERVLRGEDLRDDPRAYGEPDDPPLVLQPFEPDYVLPEYRAHERLDGEVPDPSEQPEAGWTVMERAQSGSAVSTMGADVSAAAAGPTAAALRHALEEVVAPWATQSGGTAHVAAVRGGADDACGAVLARLGQPDADAAGDVLGGPVGGPAGGLASGPADQQADERMVRVGPVDVATMLRMVAFAGASGGVHGRRRGGAAGRALAWWVARCATGLQGAVGAGPDEVEFRLEDREIRAFRVPIEAAWRLELAIGSGTAGTDAAGGSGAEWAVAVAAFDIMHDTHDEPAPW